MTQSIGHHPNRWNQWALWSAMAAALASMCGYGGVYEWVWVPVSIALSLSLAIFLIARARRGRNYFWHPLLWPAFAFFVLVSAQAVFHLSTYPGATYTGLAQLATDGIVLYFALYALRSERAMVHISKIIYWTTAALSTEALAQYFTSPKLIYWIKDASYATPVGPFYYHNHYAGCIDVLLPITLAYALHHSRRNTSELFSPWLLVPALAFASIIVSQSRGGLFALCCEAALFFTLYRHSIRRNRKTRRLTLVLAGTVLAFSLLAGWGPIAHRLIALSYHDTSSLDRMRVAESCVHIWRAHPVLGTGFGTFPSVYPAYQTFDSGQRWLQAHNEYAQALAETGTVGILCILAFVVVFLYRSRSLFGSTVPSASPRHILRPACFIGACGFMIHSFGDFLFHAPADAMFFLIAVAAAVTSTNHSADSDQEGHARLREAVHQ